MDGMKYISYDRAFSYRAIIVFPADIDHSFMVQQLYIETDDIVGAGFVVMDDDDPQPRCRGKSTSLEKKAHEGDTALLHRLLTR